MPVEPPSTNAFPGDGLVLVPIRDAVMFPGIVLPIKLSRNRSVKAVREAARRQRPIGIVLQRRPEAEEADENGLFRFGTQAAILRFAAADPGIHQLVCKGEKRFRVIEFLKGFPFAAARVELIDEREILTPDIERRMRRLKERAGELLEMMPQFPSELRDVIRNVDSPGRVADFIAAFAGLTLSEKQEILEIIDAAQRIDRLQALLEDRIAALRPSP
jgi:ATP-dependent Lon protease